MEEKESEIVDIYESEDFENYNYIDLPDKTGKIKEKVTDYAKIAKAIGDIQSQGVKLSLVNINTSDYGFKPDVENNRILYGLKAISNVNSDMIKIIKENRPYYGIKDFMSKVKLGKVAMVNLIKGGAFDEVDKDFIDRKMIMAYYVSQISEPKSKLTLQNFNGLITRGLVPQKLELQIRVYNFNKYLKNHKVGIYYTLDTVSMSFLENALSYALDNVEVINGVFCIKIKSWESIYKKEMDIVREWLNANQQEILKAFNLSLFKEKWDKYAKGNISHWEMEALCFYFNEHELKNIDTRKYGISNFNELPEDPVIDYFFKRGNNQIPIYKLTSIVGTVIAKNDTKSTVTLLTTTGVVNVKFSREYYAMFKKQISRKNPDGTKTVMEKGWFTRGTMIMVTGFRREDTFVAKTYKSTNSHQLYKIIEVCGDEIKLQHERFSAQDCYEEDEIIQY